MKKSVLAIVALAVAVALPAFAADPKPEAKPPKPKSHEYTGDVKAVDAAKHSVTVSKKEGDEKTFTVSDKAKISVKDKAAAELSDLKVGDKVTVRYMEEDGKDVAHKISPPDAPKKKAAESK